MTRHVLVTNDDGVDAPVLPALARALAELENTIVSTASSRLRRRDRDDADRRRSSVTPSTRVSVVVPDGERSWISKAVTREHPITVDRVERDGVAMTTTSGTPADCVQLAVSGLLGEAVDVVVSGVNLGRNHGAAFVPSSGTIGAAMEGAIAGIPSFAVSTGEPPGDDYGAWRQHARTPDALAAWGGIAGATAAIVADVLATDVFATADLVSVNLPWDATPTTERRVTTVAPVRYQGLFRRVDERSWRHDRAPLVAIGELAGSDQEAVDDDVVSICALTLPRAVDLPDDVRSALVARTGATPVVDRAPNDIASTHSHEGSPHG